jgi:hypothetical protein
MADEDAPAPWELARPSDEVRRLIEDQAAFRDGSPTAAAVERLSLRGLTPPAGRVLQLRYLPGELFDLMPWDGHRVEVLTVPLGPGSRIPASHPWEFDQFPEIEGPCLIVRWRIRDISKPGLLEVTWDRRGPGRIARRIGEVGGAVTASRAGRLWALWPSRRRTAIPKGARKAGGRRKLEESPTSEWRWFADRAIEMLREEPTLSIKDAAVRLELPRYDERIDMDDRDVDRADQSAEKKLRRWIKRRKEELGRQAGK